MNTYSNLILYDQFEIVLQVDDEIEIFRRITVIVIGDDVYCGTPRAKKYKSLIS